MSRSEDDEWMGEGKKKNKMGREREKECCCSLCVFCSVLFVCLNKERLFIFILNTRYLS